MSDAVKFIGCGAEFSAARAVIFGAPFDGTTSYRPGARFGPAAIRAESYGFETYSPYQDADLEDVPAADCGDLEIPPGNARRALSLVEERAEEILRHGKIPLMLGGEHLVTLGALTAAHRHYPDLCLIHFDAHADLRDEYLGEPLSHACVIRRCHEILGDGRIFQFGIRSGERSEFLWSARGHTSMERFGFETLRDRAAALAGRPVYFTLDLDVLDPSVLPGTGTPEPGGVGFRELRLAAQTVCRMCRVVAADVCELAPALDTSGASTAAAVVMAREMLIALGSK